MNSEEMKVFNKWNCIELIDSFVRSVSMILNCLVIWTKNVEKVGSKCSWQNKTWWKKNREIYLSIRSVNWKTPIKN